MSDGPKFVVTLLLKILFESDPNFSNQMTPEAAKELPMLSKMDKTTRETIKPKFGLKSNAFWIAFTESIDSNAGLILVKTFVVMMPELRVRTR